MQIGSPLSNWLTDPSLTDAQRALRRQYVASVGASFAAAQLVRREKVADKNAAQTEPAPPSSDPSILVPNTPSLLDSLVGGGGLSSAPADTAGALADAAQTSAEQQQASQSSSKQMLLIAAAAIVGIILLRFLFRRRR